MPAPTKVQLTGGKFQDAEGNIVALGHLVMELVQDEQLSSDAGQVCSGIKITYNLDSNGSVSTSPAQYAWSPENMIPAGASYTAWVYTAEGQLVWGPNYNLDVPIGATFDVGTWIPNTTNGGTGSANSLTLQTNEVNNGSQSLLDLHAGTGITLTDNGAGQITIGGNPTLVLETNGVSNGSQSVLDLYAGNNITLTDNGSGQITVAAADGGFATPGQGYIVPYELAAVVLTGGGSEPAYIAGDSVAINSVVALQFNLPYAVTISAISLFVLTGGGASSNLCTAIYDVTGTTKLIDAGTLPFDCHTTSQVVRRVTITPVTLQPGVYWWAVANPELAGAVLGLTAYQYYPGAINAGHTRFGISSNALAAGVMPASLGTIAPMGTASAISFPFVMFEV